MLYTDDGLEVLHAIPGHIAADDEQQNRILYNRYRNVRSNIIVAHPDEQVEGVGEISRRYHLYHELVHSNRYMSLCKDCFIALQSGRRPDRSICTGYDLGNPARCGLLELNWMEELCIVRTRVLTSAVNLRLPKPRGHYHSVRGHCIAFPDEAATTCGLRMPDLGFAGEQVLLTIKGSVGATTSRHLEGAIRRLGILQVDVAKVLDWLTITFKCQIRARDNWVDQ